jgi:hypothetical protein
MSKHVVRIEICGVARFTREKPKMLICPEGAHV